MRNLSGPARIVKERGHKPQGIYRGRLSEPYDGIGQYVSVALAGSSVGSAYKARVAAGDFGGGRIFPKGTPVTVFSFRGNLEVMLGNHPQSCLIDEFNRDTGPLFGVSADSWSSDVLTPPYSGGGSSSLTSGIADDRAYLTVPPLISQGYSTVSKRIGIRNKNFAEVPIEVTAIFETNQGDDIGGSNGLGGASGFMWDYSQGITGPTLAFIQVLVGAAGSTLAGTRRWRASISLDIYDEDFNTLDSFSGQFLYPTSYYETNGQNFTTKIRFDYTEVSVKTWLTADTEPEDWDVTWSDWNSSLLQQSLEAGGYDVNYNSVGLEAAEGNYTYWDYFKYCDNLSTRFPEDLVGSQQPLS